MKEEILMPYQSPSVKEIEIITRYSILETSPGGSEGTGEGELS